MEIENSILQGSEEEVRGAIQAFEEILEAMPNDRVALETLFEGHLMLQQSAKAAKYLARLAETILEENDMDALQGLMPALHQHAGLNEDVAAILNRSEHQLNGNEPQPLHGGSSAEQPAAGESSQTARETPRLNTRDLTAELSLAWNIHQAGELNEEEYAGVVQDLSELSSRNLNTPVTVLHVLQDRHSSSLEKVIQFLVQDTDTPFIKFSQFELNENSIPIRLPEAIARHRGALVYGVMASDAMVGILNPYDEELKQKVREILGTTCHFFLTSSTEYDLGLQKLYTSAPKESEDSETLDIVPNEEQGKSGRKSGLRLKT